MQLKKNLLNMIKYLVFSLLLIGVSSCQNDPLEVVRSVTYKPEFHYISQQKWAHTMRQFETNLGILNRSLEGSNTMNEDQRQSALSILNRLDRLSLDLAQETLNTHRDFSLFRSGIKTARMELLQTPPKYEQISSISIYCTNCHSKTGD